MITHVIMLNRSAPGLNKKRRDREIFCAMRQLAGAGSLAKQALLWQEWGRMDFSPPRQTLGCMLALSVVPAICLYGVIQWAMSADAWRTPLNSVITVALLAGFVYMIWALVMEAVRDRKITVDATGYTETHLVCGRQTSHLHIPLHEISELMIKVRHNSKKTIVELWIVKTDGTRHMIYSDFSYPPVMARKNAMMEILSKHSARVNDGGQV
ncbi:hypothetical protein DB346_08380 [Verrucomicrobia bacterium LW23]|nr:hypothetical protein DB346_08380 [Verrucomicrobia bacterium LW23]